MFLFLQCLWQPSWAEPCQGRCVTLCLQQHEVNTPLIQSPFGGCFIAVCSAYLLAREVITQLGAPDRLFYENQNSNTVPFHWATKERQTARCLLEWRASISCLIQSTYFCTICRKYFKRTNIFKTAVSVLLHSHNLFSASNQMLFPTTL